MIWCPCSTNFCCLLSWKGHLMCDQKEKWWKNYKYLRIAIITFLWALWPYHDRSTGKTKQIKKKWNKRLWHSWWYLRLPQSCLFGLTSQLMATDMGSSRWPQEHCSVGRAIWVTDSWLMVPESSAARKPCCCSEKEKPGFYTLCFFWSSVAHAAACKVPANTVCCSWSDRLAAGLRLAGTSGDGLIRPPVQSNASYSRAASN